MIRCLDIHTHHPAPQPFAVVSVTMDNFNPIEGQLYSLGIHPWDADTRISPDQWKEFERLAALPCVVAIGECGIDLVKGTFLFRQLQLLKPQIDISERLGKPLILHDVKAHDVIVGLRRELNVKQNWAVHGFRYKPTVARMLTDAGIFLSFGEKFNTQSPAVVPPGMLLAETDESSLTIQQVIAGLSENLSHDMTDTIAENTAAFLGR